MGWWLCGGMVAGWMVDWWDEGVGIEAGKVETKVGRCMKQKKFETNAEVTGQRSFRYIILNI